MPSQNLKLVLTLQVGSVLQFAFVLHVLLSSVRTTSTTQQSLWFLSDLANQGLEQMVLKGTRDAREQLGLTDLSGKPSI